MGNSTVEKPRSSAIIKWSKLYHHPWGKVRSRVSQQVQCPLCDTDAKSMQSKSDRKKTSNKPKLREMLQNNWPLMFKSAMVMNAKKRLNTEGDVKTKCNMALS